MYGYHGENEGGMNWEIVIAMYTLLILILILYIK